MQLCVSSSVYVNGSGINKKSDLETILLDARRKLNIHETFRRRLGRLLNVLCTFNLRPVPRGIFKITRIRCATEESIPANDARSSRNSGRGYQIDFLVNCDPPRKKASWGTFECRTANLINNYVNTLITKETQKACNFIKKRLQFRYF